MAYDLDQFIADCRSTLARDPGPAGREQVRTISSACSGTRTSSRNIAATTSRAG